MSIVTVLLCCCWTFTVYFGSYVLPARVIPVETLIAHRTQPTTFNTDDRQQRAATFAQIVSRYLHPRCSSSEKMQEISVRVVFHRDGTFEYILPECLDAHNAHYISYALRAASKEYVCPKCLLEQPMILVFRNVSY